MELSWSMFGRQRGHVEKTGARKVGKEGLRQPASFATRPSNFTPALSDILPSSAVKSQPRELQPRLTSTGLDKSYSAIVAQHLH